MVQKHDVKEIDDHIARVHDEVGAGPFTSLGLMALERLVREHDPKGFLPSKTLLRERLNAFRAARWPHLKPKKTNRSW